MKTPATLSWPWPVRWDDALKLVRADGGDASSLAEVPVLAGHRELDRLGAYAWALHRGEAGAEERLRQAMERLGRAAPWLKDVAREIESNVTERCECGFSPSQQLQANEAARTGGFIDDGSVSTLLACVTTLAGEDAAMTVIGLMATAMAAERGLPGATRASDSSAVRDLALLAVPVGTPRTPVAQQIVSGEGASLGVSSPPMQTLSGTLPGGLPGLPPGIGGPKPGIPGLGPKKGGWGIGTKPEDLGIKPKLDPEIYDHGPIRPQLPLVPIDRDEIRRIGCLLRLIRLLVPEPPPPRLPPGAPVTWTTGITSVKVVSPCGNSPTLIIRGHGFGSAPKPGIGVIAPMWDAVRRQVVCRPVPVISWSNTVVKVQLPENVVGGVAGFADVAWIAAYDAWVERENARVKAVLEAAACLGSKPPDGLVIRQPWSDCPPALPAATFRAGMPALFAELVPVSGPVLRWRKDLVRLSAGEAFRVNWVTANATKVELSENPTSSGVLAAASKPSKSTVAASGSELLVASTTPGRIKLTLVASNECATVWANLEAVGVGPALELPTITAVCPLPGGDLNVVVIDGNETLQPDTRSIPLVAGKRTVLRVDWQIAVPQAPAGETVIVTARIWAHVPSYPGGPVSVELRAQADTSQPPPAPSAPPLELKPAQAFVSAFDYFIWQLFTADQGSLNPGTFNFVLPPSMAVGDVTLTVYVQARSPGTGKGGDDLWWNTSAATTIHFHQRRSVKIRYQRWGANSPPNDAPTDTTANSALVADSPLLPFPDPPIIALSPNAVTSNGRLIEDLFAMKGNTPGASGPEEIWLTMGAAGSGGYAPSSMPWCAATDPTRCVSAHEIGHMLGQNHINYPGCGPANGEDPATFPDNAQVLVIGWDQWRNAPVRGGVDLMSYCWGTNWMSPERWHRIFLKAGK